LRICREQRAQGHPHGALHKQVTFGNARANNKISGFHGKLIWLSSCDDLAFANAVGPFH
jgi:hypothetical protein